MRNLQGDLNSGGTVSMLYGNNHRAIKNLRDEGYGAAGFHIKTVPLYYNVESDNNIVTNGWKSKKYTTYRTDTGEELGVHGENYRAIKPSHMIDTCRNILERSDLNLNGITEDIQTSHNGSRTFVQYRLPEVSYSTGDGDHASLSLLGITSFDSTWPFMISAAAIQQACLNLQVFTQGDVALYKSRHTKGIDLDAGARIINDAVHVFSNETELWQKWQNQYLTTKDVILLFATTVGCKPILELYKSGAYPSDLDRSIRASKAMSYIMDKYTHTYKPKFGKTMWSAYNALTDWSTHAPAKNNIASVRNYRQSQVRKFFQGIESNSWLNVA